MDLERKLAIDSAPGKELISTILKSADLKTFEEFYKIRRDWHGYPLVHDGLVTYGILSDLMTDLTEETQSVLIIKAIELAEEESDEFFLCGIHLIVVLLSGLHHISEKELKKALRKLKKLRNRARKLSLLPNMTCFWGQIVNHFNLYCSGGIDPIEDKDWLQFHSLNLKHVDKHGWENCPEGDSLIKEEIAGISGGEFILEFSRSAYYEGKKYWVWLYRNISENPIWHFYVYITVSPKGKAELFRHSMHTVVNVSPEELVIRHHYGLIG